MCNDNSHENKDNQFSRRLSSTFFWKGNHNSDLYHYRLVLPPIELAIKRILW